ncbi:MAG: GSCFA domain-containing protein [Granulosicoccus sp.]
MNPYEQLPSKAFWKPAVAERSIFDIEELWDPKFFIRKNNKVVTFGSCFAQHIGNALKNRGFNWLNTEPAPFGMLDSSAKSFNYNVFSARTGNIYTTSLLKQWTEWALDEKPVPKVSWIKDDRYFDPFRPRIEPDGFASPEELHNSLLRTTQAFRRCIEQANFFVFTLGLTESWVDTKEGYEYPVCPGTLAGEFDAVQHQFINQQFNGIHESLTDSITMMKKINPSLRFLLTVSPVPLTATNSGKHVAVATMASKSILRAVTDQLSTNDEHIDYFPSYEIINSPVFKGIFFEPNMRGVNPFGVNFVMDTFFKCLERKFGKYPVSKAETAAANDDAIEAAHCEEELLEAFAK